MAEPVIQTHNLTKVFKDFWHRPRVKAVDDLNLTIERGEVFGLLGPNGSGKSTTIKLVLGLLFPTQGQVSILGKPPHTVESKRAIGFLPEESYLYQYLDAEETLDFYARLFDLPAAERRNRIDALLQLTGLSGARQRLVGEYSKGMQRRIGIAQALINDPDLIILDEPTSGLDPLGTREMKDLILRLKEKGKTVLLSSHLLADVEDVCDRIAILYGGRLQAAGTTGTLLRKGEATEITAPLSEAALDEVLAFMRERLSADEAITVRPPQERLEDFFLRIITEARSADQPTSGVEATAGKLDFLTATEEEDSVLDRLTQPHPEPAPPREAPPAAPVTEPVSEPPAEPASTSPAGAVLEDLTQPQPAPPDTPAPPEPEEEAPGPADTPQVDQSILDRLSKPDRED